MFQWCCKHLKIFSVDNLRLCNCFFFSTFPLRFQEFSVFSFGSGTSKMCSSNEEMAYGERSFLAENTGCEQKSA